MAEAQLAPCKSFPQAVRGQGEELVDGISLELLRQVETREILPETVSDSS